MFSGLEEKFERVLEFARLIGDLLVLCRNMLPFVIAGVLFVVFVWRFVVPCRLSLSKYVCLRVVGGVDVDLLLRRVLDFGFLRGGRLIVLVRNGDVYFFVERGLSDVFIDVLSSVFGVRLEYSNSPFGCVWFLPFGVRINGRWLKSKMYSVTFRDRLFGRFPRFRLLWNIRRLRGSSFLVISVRPLGWFSRLRVGSEVKQRKLDIDVNDLVAVSIVLVDCDGRGRGLLEGGLRSNLAGDMSVSGRIVAANFVVKQVVPSQAFKNYIAVPISDLGFLIYPYPDHYLVYRFASCRYDGFDGEDVFVGYVLSESGEEVGEYYIDVHEPFHGYVVGVTGSGKTSFVCELIGRLKDKFNVLVLDWSGQFARAYPLNVVYVEDLNLNLFGFPGNVVRELFNDFYYAVYRSAPTPIIYHLISTIIDAVGDLSFSKICLLLGRVRNFVKRDHRDACDALRRRLEVFVGSSLDCSGRPRVPVEGFHVVDLSVLPGDHFRVLAAYIILCAIYHFAVSSSKSLNLIVVVDEAHRLFPEVRVKVEGERTFMGENVVLRFYREARKHGVGMICISPVPLHPDVAGMSLLKVVMKIEDDDFRVRVARDFGFSKRDLDRVKHIIGDLPVGSCIIKYANDKPTLVRFTVSHRTLSATSAKTLHGVFKYGVKSGVEPVRVSVSGREVLAVVERLEPKVKLRVPVLADGDEIVSVDWSVISVPSEVSSYGPPRPGEKSYGELIRFLISSNALNTLYLAAAGKLSQNNDGWNLLAKYGLARRSGENWILTVKGWRFVLALKCAQQSPGLLREVRA